MKNIFFGLIFIVIDINIELLGIKLNLLPDFIGYTLIFISSMTMSTKSSFFIKLKKLCFVGILYDALLLMINIMGHTNDVLSVIGYCFSIIIMLTVTYFVTKAVKDIEQKSEKEIGYKNLLSSWNRLLACSVSVFLAEVIINAYIPINSYILNTIFIIIQSICGFLFIVEFYKIKSRYYK